MLCKKSYLKMYDDDDILEVDQAMEGKFYMGYSLRMNPKYYQTRELWITSNEDLRVGDIQLNKLTNTTSRLTYTPLTIDHTCVRVVATSNPVAKEYGLIRIPDELLSVYAKYQGEVVVAGANSKGINIAAKGLQKKIMI